MSKEQNQINEKRMESSNRVHLDEKLADNNLRMQR